MRVCPPSDLLADLFAGRLEDDSAAALADHLDECTGCRDTLDSLGSADTVDPLIAGLRRARVAEGAATDGSAAKGSATEEHG